MERILTLDFNTDGLNTIGLTPKLIKQYMSASIRTDRSFTWFGFLEEYVQFLCIVSCWKLSLVTKMEMISNLFINISRNWAVKSWLCGLKVLKEAFNILYHCMSFLLRSSCPFVVSFSLIVFKSLYDSLYRRKVIILVKSNFVTRIMILIPTSYSIVEY